VTNLGDTLKKFFALEIGKIGTNPTLGANNYVGHITKTNLAYTKIINLSLSGQPRTTRKKKEITRNCKHCIVHLFFIIIVHVNERNKNKFIKKKLHP